MNDEADLSWYSVRCVFAVGWPREGFRETYEERITLWRARSAEEAMERAETEALEYAENIMVGPTTYLGLAQSYHLFDDPADGAEIFSLMRDSNLDAKKYLDTFFDVGTERQATPPVSEGISS